MPTTEELVSKFKPNNTPDSLGLPSNFSPDDKKLVFDLLLQIYLARNKAEGLGKAKGALEEKLLEVTETLRKVSGVSRVTFWSAIGGLALLLITCFIITWTTRPSVGEIQEATRRHSVTEALRNGAKRCHQPPRRR